jgi:PAS domain S-box-containing protein
LPFLEVLVWGLCLVILALVIHHLRRVKTLADVRTPGTGDDLFESAPIGYAEVNREGLVLRVNRQYAKLLGRERAELLGKHCQELAPPAQREKYREQMEQRLSGHASIAPYQCEYDRPDGGKVVVEVHEERLTSAAGEVAGLRMAVVDVTERKQSDEQAFHIANEQRALFQALPDFFLRLDRDGKVQEAKGGQKSDAFLAAEKFLGRNLRDVLPPDAVEQFVLAQERGKRTKAMSIAEFEVGPEQEQQAYEMRLIELDWEQWIAIVRNITARKSNEIKLKGYAQELERKNEEMEAALLTAREATQLKSRFMANISHEIRTPMNGVLGMTELLLGTALKEEQQEYAESIKRSATSLLSLINDILDLSRVEAGKLRIEQVPFSLKTIVEETSSLFALQARTKGLEFLLEVAPNVPASAVGDGHRLRQVLNNLLGNAIKFTDAGRISLTVSLLGEAAGRLQVRFSVRDTGIGVSRSDQERIFERFIQADTSSTRKYGGTGLGLAISKELVELLGGEIGVESEVDRGSQFWFTISLGKAAASEERANPAPAAKAPAQTAKSPVPGAIPVQISPGASAPKPQPSAGSASAAGSLANLTAALRGRKHRILLAEDNEINQRITVRLLEKLGLAVDAVTNGRLAVEAINKKKYELIFMDCQMPEMDGFEATAMIRNRERNAKRTPICALTANAMEGDRERCLAAGMDDYISKPVSLEKLQEAITRWIPGADSPAQPAASVIAQS